MNAGIEPETEFSSLLNMLEVINHCFEDGVYYLNERGALDADDLRAALLAARYNPELPLYQA